MNILGVGRWCALFALASGLLQGQVQSRLTGTVNDSTGAVIPGAVVTVRNVATGVSQTAETTENGGYNFPFLQPGEYELAAESAGFKRFSQRGITLETGFSRTVNIALVVGEVSETVTVEASTPLLETESSTVGQFVERTTVMNMPVESRRSASLVRLMGMVVYSQEAGGEQIPRFSMAGGRSMNQMWQLDGAVTQNMALGVPQLSLNPPAESLQEFKAETGNYSAEFGRAGGGLILMTTRAGTNEYHGAIYEFFRNDKLDTRTFFAPDVAPLRYNIFGGSYGGPIKKDKTFFFANYEGARRRDGVTISNSTVPHPIEVGGDFSNRAGFTLIDPVTREPFPNNVIPESRMDPLGRRLAELYPAPNAASPLDRAPRNNYVVNVSDALQQDYLTTRVDHNVGDNDKIFGRLALVRAPQTVAAVFPDPEIDNRGGTRSNRHVNIVGSWFHNFAPTVINEARYMYGNRMHINRAFGTGSGVNGELGIEGVNPDAFAQVTAQGYSNLGSGTHERIQKPILTQQFDDTLTWLKGSHQVKMGVGFRYSLNRDDQNAATGGRFGHNARATGDGLASLLLGWTTSGRLIDTDLLEVRTDYYAGFIQDDWKVRPNLTLNLGLRWELDTPRFERNNRQSGVDLTAINPVSGTPGAMTFAGINADKWAHEFDKNNFGPRVGLAYRLGDDTVIRTGYGLSYNGAYARAVPNSTAFGFSLDGSFNSPDNNLSPAFILSDGMPPVVREELTPGFGAVPVGQPAVLAPDFFEQDHSNGYMQQWNLTIQRQLGFDMVAEIGYIANMGHKLGGADVDINMIPLVDGRGPAQARQADRPYPQYQGVIHKSPDWGNSSYHALNAKIEKRYSSGLNFLANYTWSKFLDDIEASNELGGESGNGYQHIALRHLDKALSGNHVAHRFVVSGVYELPWGKSRQFGISNPVLNAFLGDWGLGSVLEARTGTPFGVIEQVNTLNAFSASQRPHLLGDIEKTAGWRDNVKGTTYFDTSVFVAPGAGVVGSAPRNVCCGPGFLGWDASVHKWFNFTERWRLQFRSDFFNVLNRANFANPGLNRGGPGFGEIASVVGGSTGRQVQLSLRLEF